MSKPRVLYHDDRVWILKKNYDVLKAAHQNEAKVVWARVEDQDNKIKQLYSKIDALKSKLERLADIVDESLLLDEKLADAWDDLRKAIVKARKG